jgi:hypothetical protein
MAEVKNTPAGPVIEKRDFRFALRMNMVTIYETDFFRWRFSATNGAQNELAARI